MTRERTYLGNGVLNAITKHINREISYIRSESILLDKAQYQELCEELFRIRREIEVLANDMEKAIKPKCYDYI